MRQSPTPVLGGGDKLVLFNPCAVKGIDGDWLQGCCFRERGRESIGPSDGRLIE